MFTPRRRKQPGKKGPSEKFIHLTFEMKTRHPSDGCLRIAMQIEIAFGIKIKKDVVGRVLPQGKRDTLVQLGESV